MGASRHRDAFLRLQQRLLERTSGRRPVIVPEYPLRPRARWGWDEAPPPGLIKTFATREPQYEETIDAMLSLRDWCATVPRQSSDPDGAEPVWDDDYWGGLDAVVQAAELKRRRPALYLEVGSGNSTRFARRAAVDFGLDTKIVSIDPAPRAQIDALCDEVLRRPAEEVLPEKARELRPGDILFIDGTHTALMNSDATVAICEVIPALPQGVVVQIDDIFLPWDYPPDWSERWYGEQYLVGTYLLGGAAGWRLTFPAWYLTQLSDLASRFEELWPLVEGRFGRMANSFWFETLAAS